MSKPNTLPTIADLYSDNIEQVARIEELTVLLNKAPKADWVKEHPYIKGYKYLPIDKVEHMMRVIFKQYKIEITGQGQSFNGVYVTVRVHYLHPITGEWLYHDGIGAIQLQTKSGSSPADLQNINNGALSMAYPLAKSLAVKDACDHFGKVFGSDLNRKDVVQYEGDKNILHPIEFDELFELWELKKDSVPAQDFANLDRIISNKEKTSYRKMYNYLQTL